MSDDESIVITIWTKNYLEFKKYYSLPFISRIKKFWASQLCSMEKGRQKILLKSETFR